MAITPNSKVQVREGDDVKHAGLQGKVARIEEGKDGQAIYAVNIQTGKPGRPPVGRYTEDQLAVIEMAEQVVEEEAEKAEAEQLELETA